MPRISLKKAIRTITVAALALVLSAAAASSDVRERIRIPIGRSEVVTSTEFVRTVAIAEPKIADAAVGSERTVVVSAKGIGTTTLVVYTEGGRFNVYDIEVYRPNADKQVAIHVRVAEVNDNAKRELGFDLLGGGLITSGKGGEIVGGMYPTKVKDPSVPLGVGPLTDGFVTYQRPDLFIQSTWKALEEKGDLRALANPTLVARSGEKASFLAGGEFPIPISSSGGGAGANIAVTIEWKQFGVKVDFKPTVEEDGSITLDVTPEVSQPNFSQGIEINGFKIPSMITRRAGTTVHLEPGQNLVIGGLKQSEKSKSVKRVPILGQIPLVSFFFSHTVTEKVNRELLLVVSPEILTGSTRMPQLPTDEKR